jgi:3-oxoadipate enol-lactonase
VEDLASSVTLKLQHSDSGATGKPALIFIHGFPFNQTMWKEQVALCEPRFRVITYDQRGHGQSEVGTGRYMFEFFVDDLLGLMDRLQIEKAVLCGLSMGGYVALRTAEREPKRIQGLVLCDTKSESDADAGKLKRAADLRLIQEQGLEAFADRFSKAVLAPSNVPNTALLDRVRRMILGNPTEGVQGALIALATRTDTTASLSRIQVPTLILVGEADAVTPPAAAAAMKERIAHAKMAAIPNAGHMSNLENPSVFNTHLMEFLGGIISV